MDRFSLSFIAFLAAINALKGLFVIYFVAYITLSWSSSVLNTSLTTPISYALLAFMNSDVKMYLMALTLPAILANLHQPSKYLCVPPIPGIKPNLNSGNPNLASSEQKITSQRSANSNPPPSATPLTPAMIGFLAL